MVQRLNNVGPWKLLALLIVSIFTVEFVIMLVLNYLVNLDFWTESFLDSFFLTVIIYPILYLFAFRPLMFQIKKTNEEKAKYGAILASIGEGVIAIDGDRRVLLLNKIGEELLGWREKDLIGKVINDLPLVDGDGHLVPLEKRPTYVSVTTGKAVTTTDSFFVRTDKTKFPIGITVSPIILNGKKLGAIAVFRNITKEKEVDRMKTEFISLASHQLRTPLGIMKWYLEALTKDVWLKKAPQTVQDYIEQLRKSNERVLNLVHDMLSISRIDSGKVKNTPQPINIPAVIQDIIKQLQIVARKKNVDLSIVIKPKSLPKISIDTLQFHEVIENLVANAIEYNATGGKVDVIVDVVKNSLTVTVQDTGIGISQQDQKKLFTRFFRSEKAVSQNPEGSGLGLYVVKSYVESWGGNITVASVEGKSSAFTINLPIAKKTA
ncbi:MAG: sensor histidine kinase [Candidatus Levyibacteriota bacterium]